MTVSSIIEDSVQIDGRRMVREKHVIDGIDYFAEYMAEEGAVVEDMLPIRAAQLEASILETQTQAANQQILDINRATALLGLSDIQLEMILQKDNGPLDAEIAQLQIIANQ